MNFNKIPHLIILLIFFSIILRFYNLNWGAPFYFHPDERNIASSVSQLQFPHQMNPHFFAYGSLPIYVIYFTGVLVNFFIQLPDIFVSGFNPSLYLVKFEQAIVVSRVFSASFSILLIPLLFWLGKKLKDERTGLLAAFLAVFSTGFIQYAHFGTFEMWLTITSVLLFISCIKILREHSFDAVLLAAIISGLIAGIKVSYLPLFIIPIIAICYSNFSKVDTVNFFKKTRFFIRDILVFAFFSYCVYFITNVYVFLDINSFMGSMRYESGVALGTLPVFYTGEFLRSIPVVFQFINVYPFLLNPLLTVLFIPSLFYLLFRSVKERNKKYALLNIFFLVLFFSQAFLYVKWARYLVPALPFIYVIISITLIDFWKYIFRKKNAVSVEYYLLFIFIGINVLFGVSYFITAFVRSDTREAAAEWARANIPSNAGIISEVYDLGITPFNSSFSNITLFNFYDLESDSIEYNERSLNTLLLSSDYIILPSQRIQKVRLQDPKNFPNGYDFYARLFNGLTDFRKIYETPCDLFCRITYLNNPVGSFEETASVFDRPTVFIFKKN